VSGLLSQQKDGCLVPAYIMSLGFTISLGDDGPIYWPGSCFAAVRLCFAYSSDKDICNNWTYIAIGGLVRCGINLPHLEGPWLGCNCVNK
jgi:hypothetical protein